MKYLDAKFDRKKTPEAPQQNGGLFIDKNGNLKNNSSSTEISKVSADALPSPVKTQVTSFTLLMNLLKIITRLKMTHGQ